MNPIILIIAAGALLLHFAKKPTKQNTVQGTGTVIDTQTLCGVGVSGLEEGTNHSIPKFAYGYENLKVTA